MSFQDYGRCLISCLKSGLIVHIQTTNTNMIVPMLLRSPVWQLKVLLIWVQFEMERTKERHFRSVLVVVFEPWSIVYSTIMLSNSRRSRFLKVLRSLISSLFWNIRNEGIIGQGIMGEVIGESQNRFRPI